MESKESKEANSRMKSTIKLMEMAHDSGMNRGVTALEAFAKLSNSKRLRLLSILYNKKGFMKYRDIRKKDTRNAGVVKRDLEALYNGNLLLKKKENSFVGKNKAKMEIDAYKVNLKNPVVKVLISKI
jgi:hypothetical protein